MCSKLGNKWTDSSYPTMKGLPQGFPDVNNPKYWRGPKSGNPDGCYYDPTHTVFFIRDYIKDVKIWFDSQALSQLKVRK